MDQPSELTTMAFCLRSQHLKGRYRRDQVRLFLIHMRLFDRHWPIWRAIVSLDARARSKAIDARTEKHAQQAVFSVVGGMNLELVLLPLLLL